jgi:hypothetical protein
MAQLTLGARAQLNAFKAVTVKHAHLTRVDDQLSLWVEEHTDATHILLCGPGGVGKSKALDVVAERLTREESDRFVVPILLLEPIPPDLGSYLRLDYYWQIINALKEHLLVKELLENTCWNGFRLPVIWTPFSNAGAGLLKARSAA